jgi:hypothetical protein
MRHPAVSPPHSASGSAPSSSVDDSAALWFTQEVHPLDASLKS